MILARDADVGEPGVPDQCLKLVFRRRDREDDERSALDPVSDLGARPQGARQTSLSRKPGEAFLFA